MADVQCQAVIFGGCTDNGYARLLQPHVRDNVKNKRIVLIEGPPFVKELVRLKDKFLVACFPDVFRNTGLQPRRVSLSTTPPATPVPTAVSYAAIVNPVDGVVIGSHDAYNASRTVPERKAYPVLQNSKGQRLDAIINPSLPLVGALRGRRLCNPFHVLGACPFKDCAFVHGDMRLDEKEIEARRSIARTVPCPSGLRCGDERCLYGHQCPHKPCEKRGKSCRFKPEMHDVSRT